MFLFFIAVFYLRNRNYLERTCSQKFSATSILTVFWIELRMVEGCELEERRFLFYENF